MINAINLNNAFRFYPAITYENNVYTYADVEIIKNIFVTHFKKQGISIGKQVGVYMSSSFDFIVSVLALWELGATIVPLDSQWSAAECVKISRFADLHYILLSKNKIDDIFCNEFHTLLFLEKICIVEHHTIICWLKKNSSKSSWLQKINGYKNEGYFIPFTSGSTGVPKGVILKKNALINNANKVAVYTDITFLDKGLITLPLNYLFAFSQCLAHLLKGGHIVLSKCQTPLSVMREIERYSITNYSATPYFYESLCAKMSKKNVEMKQVHSLRFCMNAGGFLQDIFIRKIVNHFPSGFVFYNNYGQTEAAPRISYAGFNKKSKHFKGVGKPVPGVCITIAKEDRDKKNRIFGEVYYHSEDMMLGYYKEVLLTEQNFPSGDLGYVGESGELYIIGRKDSMIKVNGRKVFFSLVEEKLLSINVVKHIRLVKEKDDDYGEYLVAYLEVCSRLYQKEALHGYLKKKFKKILEKHERPKKIIVCKELPRASNGKISVHKMMV